MGSKKKYKNLKTISITLEQDVLDYLDKIKGQNSRGQFLKELLISKGNEIGQIVVLKQQITVLETELKSYSNVA